MGTPLVMEYPKLPWSSSQLRRVYVGQLIGRDHVGDGVAGRQLQSSIDEKRDDQDHRDHEQELF